METFSFRSISRPLLPLHHFPFLTNLTISSITSFAIVSSIVIYSRGDPYNSYYFGSRRSF